MYNVEIVCPLTELVMTHITKQHSKLLLFRELINYLNIKLQKS